MHNMYIGSMYVKVNIECTCTVYIVCTLTMVDACEVCTFIQYEDKLARQPGLTDGRMTGFYSQSTRSIT